MSLGSGLTPWGLLFKCECGHVRLGHIGDGQGEDQHCRHCGCERYRERPLVKDAPNTTGHGSDGEGQ